MGACTSKQKAVVAPVGGPVAPTPNLERPRTTESQAPPIVQNSPSTAALSEGAKVQQLRPTLLNDRYQVLGNLGKGHFSVVKKCMDTLSSRVVAVKEIKRRENNKNEGAVRAEIEVLRRLGPHENIIELYDTFETPDAYFLVLEYCEGGDLFSRIVDIGKFSELQASQLCRQLGRALEHMHSRGVVHRDLKVCFLLECVSRTDLNLSVTARKSSAII